MLKKFQKFLRLTGTIDIFDPRSGISGPTLRRASACPNIYEWWTQPRSHEMPSCLAIDLAEIQLSSKIGSWIWPVISRVVTVLGRPGQGASQVEKSPCLNWVTQFLMVACNGTCSPNVSVRMAWFSFGALSCRKKKNSLMAARALMLLKLHVSSHMLPFSLCNKKRLAIWHMNRSLFPSTL